MIRQVVLTDLKFVRDDSVCTSLVSGHWRRSVRQCTHRLLPSPRPRSATLRPRAFSPHWAALHARRNRVERRRAQSSLDRRQVCVVDRCTRLPLCVDSAWFFVCLASLPSLFLSFSSSFFLCLSLSFSLSLPPLQSPPPEFCFLSYTNKEPQCTLYVTCARKPLVA